MFCLCPRSSISAIFYSRYKSVREQRPTCNCFMTDFHQLFIVKMNKMINKKTGASFLVVYVIYVSIVYTDSKKTVSCLLPRLPRLRTIFATFRRQLKCLLVRIQGGLCLFHYVLDNLNWLVFYFCPI